jgi:hypothetical protein
MAQLWRVGISCVSDKAATRNRFFRHQLGLCCGVARPVRVYISYYHHMSVAEASKVDHLIWTGVPGLRRPRRVVYAGAGQHCVASTAACSYLLICRTRYRVTERVRPCRRRIISSCASQPMRFRVLLSQDIGRIEATPKTDHSSGTSQAHAISSTTQPKEMV